MANLVTFAKKLWKDKVGGNTPITAAELNRMEDGINNCATQINKLGDSVSRCVTAVGNTSATVSTDLEGGQYVQINVTAPDGNTYVLTAKQNSIGLWDSNQNKFIWQMVTTG